MGCVCVCVWERGRLRVLATLFSHPWKEPASQPPVSREATFPLSHCSSLSTTETLGTGTWWEFSICQVYE